MPQQSWNIADNSVSKEDEKSTSFDLMKNIKRDTSGVQLAKGDLGQKWGRIRFPKGATEWRESGCPCQNRARGGGRIFAGTELGRIWRSGSLGICRWDPAWWDWCKKGTGGKSLDKSVYFSSFLAVKEDVFRVHINFFAFHSLEEIRKQCWVWTRQKLG